MIAPISSLVHEDFLWLESEREEKEIHNFNYPCVPKKHLLIEEIFLLAVVATADAELPSSSQIFLNVGRD